MGFGQHERVSPVSARDLDAPDLQCLLINPYVYLAPDASFGAAMLARVPLAFTRCLDACAVDEEVQWSGAATTRQAHLQRLLAATKCAKVWHPSIQPKQRGSLSIH